MFPAVCGDSNERLAVRDDNAGPMQYNTRENERDTIKSQQDHLVRENKKKTRNDEKINVKKNRNNSSASRNDESQLTQSGKWIQFPRWRHRFKLLRSKKKKKDSSLCVIVDKMADSPNKRNIGSRIT
ncbi:unnamed protein product [Allacma fusca]|uniref:Uncharacterized protein n=1 Tax=Allacma fusca TaxID=39272 RepID=A0A8J2NPV5_9HEXA|nr:unnamed protein product [Allacma fusca]